MDLEKSFCYNLSMVKIMNYIDINIKNLQDNINYIRDNLAYKYFILDVSNNGFYHGMYVINELANIDYLYVNNFKDLLKVRSYNKKIPTIYSGDIEEDNIYDLIMNNAILLIKDTSILKYQDIRDDVEVIMALDSNGYIGIKEKDDIEKVISFIKNNSHIHLLGFKLDENEETYKDIILKYKAKLTIIDDFNNQNKDGIINAIKIDNEAYGINKVKKDFFKKDNNSYKQVFILKAKIKKIETIKIKKKDIKVAIIGLGYLNGMHENITKVVINKQIYDVFRVKEEYSLIKIDEHINNSDIVTITSSDNPLNIYLDENILQYLSSLQNKFPILYNEEIKILC